MCRSVLTPPWKRPWPVSGTSSPAMTRSSVVLPDPEGPSSASNSPVCTSRLTSRSAENVPNCFDRLRTSMVIVLFLIRDGPGPDDTLEHQRYQRQQCQQRSHRKCGGKVVFVVKDFHMQWHGVGAAADMSGNDRYCTEFAHRARVAEDRAV